jgi:undecaprenyl-diphosphatase
MSVFMAILLGIIQGVTEFLPVSSSGHLSLLQNLFQLQYNEADNLLFDVLLHVGTLAAVIFTYRKDLAIMFRQTSDFVTGRGDGGRDDFGRLSPSVRLLILIIAGTLPLLFVVPFYSRLEVLFGKLWFVGFALLITGGLLYASDKLVVGRKNEKTSRVADVLVVGLAQAIAVIPGLSRSGTTIAVGLARGFKRSFAVRFSFLLSLPAVIGALILSLFDAIRAGVHWELLPIYLIGMVFAAVTGFFAIKLVKKLVDSNRFGKFAYYCWAIGAIALVASIFI